MRDFGVGLINHQLDSTRHKQFIYQRFVHIWCVAVREPNMLRRFRRNIYRKTPQYAPTQRNAIHRICNERTEINPFKYWVQTF